MKSKDLKVGTEYAFGAPNSWDAKNPTRVVVVKIGVYGRPAQGDYYSGKSRHANHVEFVPAKGHHVSSHFEVVLTDEGAIHGRYSKGGIARRAYRGPAANFLRPWSEHAADAAQTKKLRAGWAAKKEADRVHRATIVEQFRAIGFTGFADYDTDVRFSVEEAEQLLELIK